MTTLLIVLSVVAIVALIAVLAVYLFWVGVLLSRIAGNLETSNEHVATIVTHTKLIVPGVEHINRTGGVVASALPLLYGFAEEIIKKVSPNATRPSVAVPASGRRRSRLHESVGFVRHKWWLPEWWLPEWWRAHCTARYGSTGDRGVAATRRLVGAAASRRPSVVSLDRSLSFVHSSPQMVPVIGVTYHSCGCTWPS